MHHQLLAVAALYAFDPIRRDLKAIAASGGGTADAATLRPPLPSTGRATAPAASAA